ncbi:MAG: hypothetical protein UX10_C0017G0013 [Candidatus Magasanikbacteria bacterium GW2011_GWA2_45_39]|uniref:Uncharacterized protein n=1 Tax=Candidatus Magasanikbacteria bacterium GW2011_GWA2_45_39 TaxID=1619041 RepID=A0A0G1MFH9_9BACT|nr:MAG: hypothetical protein UX10_C0017G0013 [Candidatus Magasanikbacteria bacterium GW2011_GWA2_45_39]
MSTFGSIKIISQPISRSALSELAKETFGDMIKAVVDVDKKIVFIEFDSMINIKPRQGNRSRGVESEEVRKKIKDVVHILII